jgi:cytochrome oxidase assembly protein ShyY1
MYRFLLRPKWIGFHLLVAAGIVAMVSLSLWQMRRLDSRQEFNARVEARFDQPAESLDSLLTPSAEFADIEWRPAIAVGTYLPDEQVLIANRSQGGRAGDNILTPLVLDDGRIMLVNRGFVPLAIDVPAAPTGTIAVEGRLRQSQQRRLGQLSDRADGELTVAQRIDIDRLAPQFPGEVAPMYLDLIRSNPAQPTGLPDPVIPPDLSEGSHLSYSVQWLIFALCVAVGWVLAVRKSIQTRALSGPNETSEDPRVEVDEPASI